MAALRRAVQRPGPVPQLVSAAHSAFALLLLTHLMLQQLAWACFLHPQATARNRTHTRPPVLLPPNPHKVRTNRPTPGKQGEWCAHNHFGCVAAGSSTGGLEAGRCSLLSVMQQGADGENDTGNCRHVMCRCGHGGRHGAVGGSGSRAAASRRRPCRAGSKSLASKQTVWGLPDVLHGSSARARKEWDEGQPPLAPGDGLVKHGQRPATRSLPPGGPVQHRVC